jgi:hypothetical protein
MTTRDIVTENKFRSETRQEHKYAPSVLCVGNELSASRMLSVWGPWFNVRDELWWPTKHWCLVPVKSMVPKSCVCVIGANPLRRRLPKAVGNARLED